MVSDKQDEASVSFGGLSLQDAMKGLLSIPDPDATKPKREKKRWERKEGRGGE